MYSCNKAENLYTSKAEKYARYRWDYAPTAITAIFNAARISDQTVVADLGAGTGILTRHFLGKAKIVYTVEPEAGMRFWLKKACSESPFCQIINSSAENTGLPAHSVDLITIGQAIHWFEPEAARSEFLRLLKPSGWLAVLRNYGTDPVYEKAVGRLFAQFSKPEPAERASRLPMPFYYGNESFQKLLFPFDFSLNWESFLGSLMSSAWIPDAGDSNYAEFEAEAREIFSTLSTSGKLKSTGETELLMGPIT